MRRAAFFLALCCALAGGLAGSASSTSRSVEWIPFHVHMNAYAHWGSCDKHDPDWRTVGHCDGTMEAGHLGSGDYGQHHSEAVSWYWSEADNDVRKFTLRMNVHTFKTPLEIVGTMPYNWHTLTITEMWAYGKRFATGTTGAKGERDGPLYVDLQSHTYHYALSSGIGYSLDLRGYVRRL